MEDINVTAARIAGRSPVLDAVAARLLANIQAEIAPHTDTGEYASSWRIEVRTGKNGVSDRYVYSNDPVAMDIEYGHPTPDGKHVAGIHAIQHAVARTKGG